MRPISRRTKFLSSLIVAIIAVAVVSRPLVHLAWTTYKDSNVIEKLPTGYADDVSRLNKTPVAGIWDMPADQAQAETQLREILLRAQASGLHVSIAGARHSMGGQTIYPAGLAI